MRVARIGQRLSLRSAPGVALAGPHVRSRPRRKVVVRVEHREDSHEGEKACEESGLDSSNTAELLRRPIPSDDCGSSEDRGADRADDQDAIPNEEFSRPLLV